MADVVHMVDDRIDDKLATGTCPRVISQATVTKTLAAYGALAAWSYPCTNFRPEGTERKSSRNQIRAAMEASFCRNGATLWKISQRRRCALTDNRFSRFMDEARFLLCTRIVLALPFDDVVYLAGPQDDPCSCHHHTKLKLRYDPHWYGCPLAAGVRNERHNELERALRFYALKANFAMPADRNVTTAGISGGESKIMDIILYEPGAAQNFWVDIVYATPVGATILQRVSRNKKAADIAWAEAIKRKADQYLREAEAHKATLVPFVIGHLGQFYPRPKEIIAKLNPTEVLSAVFPNPQDLPKRGGVSLSAEEGLTHKVAHKLANRQRGGSGVFDATLSQPTAAGMVLDQMYSTFAYISLNQTARFVERAIRAG